MKRTLPDRRLILKKLTPFKIVQMKILYKAGYSSRAIGKMFKVAGTTVLLHVSKEYKENARTNKRLLRSYKYKTDPAWRKKFIAQVIKSRKNLPAEYHSAINKRRRVHYQLTK